MKKACGARGPDGARPSCQTFKFKPKAGLGTVRANLFIKDKKAAGYKGDNRGFKKKAGAAKGRVTVLIDYETGEGIIFVNYSCKTGGGCKSANKLGLSTTESRRGDKQKEGARCPTGNPACTIAKRENPGPGVSFARVSGERSGNLSIQVHAVNSAAPRGLGAPAIDASLKVRPAGASGVQMEYSRDPYPSFEAYHDVAGQTTTMARSGQKHGPIGGLSGVFPNDTGSYP